jgi:hypothetical protein
VSTNDYDNLDVAIIEQINALRSVHQACTARAVANQLRMSPDVVRYRLQKMQGDGLVEWTEMPGSLYVIGKPAQLLPPDDELPTPEGVVEGEQDGEVSEGDSADTDQAQEPTAPPEPTSDPVDPPATDPGWTGRRRGRRGRS